MTIAQQIEEIGIKKGRIEGIQEGRQKEKRETTLNLAKQFLANGVDRNTVKLSTGLSDNELDELQ